MLNGSQNTLLSPSPNAGQQKSKKALPSGQTRTMLTSQNGDSVNGNKKLFNNTNIALNSTASALKLLSFASSNLGFAEPASENLKMISDHATTAAISGQSALGAVDAFKKGEAFATIGNLVEAFIPFGNKERVWLRRGATQASINTFVINSERLEYENRDSDSKKEKAIINLKKPIPQAASLWWGAAAIDYAKLFDPVIAKFDNLTDLSFAFGRMGSARFQTGLFNRDSTNEEAYSFDIVDGMKNSATQTIKTLKTNWSEVLKKPKLAFTEAGHGLTVASTFQFIGPFISMVNLKAGSFLRMVGAMLADFKYLFIKSEDKIEHNSTNEPALATSS